MLGGRGYGHKVVGVDSPVRMRERVIGALEVLTMVLGSMQEAVITRSIVKHLLYAQGTACKVNGQDMPLGYFFLHSACPFVSKLSGHRSSQGLEKAAAGGTGVLSMPWSGCPVPFIDTESCLSPLLC